MYDMMKKQNFGVEIELTGITRRHAAKIIAAYFGTADTDTKRRMIAENHEIITELDRRYATN